jgi:iron complex outermembrane receptor protein
MANSLVAQAVSRALWMGMVGGVAIATLIGSPALAQTAAPDEPQELTVTGTRIRQTSGMTTPVPVTSLSTEDLKMSNPGASIADQLDKLPQLFQTESAQRSSGALFGNAGASYVNLRGLGSQRTLVLLDGSRVVQDDRGGAVNVGVFPNALIKSVDIITGGASAQYGADAVGGVVNFVLDRNFQGLKASASTGITEQGDGFNYKGSVAGGMKVGDKLHLTGSLDYNHIDQIMRDPTTLGDWFQRYGFVTNPSFVSPTAGNTTSVPQRLTLPNVISSVHSPFGRIDSACKTTATFNALTNPASCTGTALVPAFTYLNNVFSADGTGVRPFVRGPISATGGTQSMSGGPEYAAANAAFPGGPYGAEVKEQAAFLGAKYDLTDRVQVYGQAMYGVSESNQPDQRGLPHQQDIWFATIYSGNPFLPAAVQNAMTAQGVDSLKMLKLGQFLNTNNFNQSEKPRNAHTMFTWSAGIEADLWGDWHLRGNYQSGSSHKFTAVFGELRVDRMLLAMDAVADPNNPGKIICNVQKINPTPAQLAAATQALYPGKLNKFGELLQSPVGLDNTISGCVPLNAFGQGNVSKAAQDYVTGNKWGISDVNQDFAELLLTGKVVDDWAGPISAAFGATYRDENFKQRAYPDALERVGPPLNLPSLGIRGFPSGFTGGSPNVFQFSTVPPIQGAYNVHEVFGELNVPLFRTSTGQHLEFDLAGRRSDYSNVGSVDSYKLGLNFTVFDDLRLRATLSRDVREATFAERFDQQGSGGAVNDPNITACRNLNGPAASANCSVQITSVAVGNPTLKPEKADTKTFGAVYRPRWLDGLQLSVDYYDVSVSDAIGQLGFQRIVSDCFNGVTSLCQYVERDATTLVIGRVLNPYLNIAKTKVRGVDYEAQYALHPDFLKNSAESLVIRAFASNLLERSNIASAGAPLTQLGGGFTAGVLYPDWKANMSLTYNVGAWSYQLAEEWISKSKIDTTWIDIADWNRGVRTLNGVAKTSPDVDNNRLPNYFNENARIGYKRDTDKGHVLDVSFFVTNLFDRHPMIIPSYNSRTGSQTISNNYDAYGRRYELGFNYKF